MKNIIYIIILFAFVSCEKIIDINIPDNGRRPTLNCFIGDSGQVRLLLHRSRYILDNSFEYDVIKNAQVVFTDHNNQTDTLTELFADGIYQSLQPALSPGSFKVQVIADGVTINSQTTIPSPVMVTGLDTGSYIFDKGENFRIDVRFSDNPNEKNYYMIGLSRPGGPPGEKPLIPIFSSDLSVTSDFRGSLLFCDDLFDGKNKTLRIETDKNNFFAPEDSIDLSIELFSLSYDAYMFFVTSQAQENTSGSPFSEPVVVYSNISEGYGIFAGYSVSRKIIRVPSYGEGGFE
jgi:hypothetical protein